MAQKETINIQALRMVSTLFGASREALAGERVFIHLQSGKQVDISDTLHHLFSVLSEHKVAKKSKPKSNGRRK